MDKLKMPSRNLPLPGLLISLLLAGCGTSSQDLLLEVRKGETYSILDLGQHLSSREAAGEEFSKGDLAAIELLRDVAGNDTVVANRMRAIAVLAGLESIESKDTFTKALKSEYWGVRWEAAKAVTAHPDPGAVPGLIFMLKNETESIILLDAVKALSAIGDEESLKALLLVYFDLTPRHANNRMKAHAALCQITGKNIPFDDVEGWLDYSRARPPATRPGAAGEKE
tara:strand:+ start:279 stop:956 length:678 start_codon:yes stop_codon:yes gene_type:complete